MEPHDKSVYIIKLKRGPFGPFNDGRWSWKVVFAEDPGTVCQTGAVYHKDPDEGRRQAIAAAQEWILTDPDSVEHWQDIDPITGEPPIRPPQPAKGSRFPEPERPWPGAEELYS